MLGGFEVTTSISTGVCGESACLIIRDTNLYPDGDSRAERCPEFIIPVPYVDDLTHLTTSIIKSIVERNQTLIK